MSRALHNLPKQTCKSRNGPCLCRMCAKASSPLLHEKLVRLHMNMKHLLLLLLSGLMMMSDWTNCLTSWRSECQEHGTAAAAGSRQHHQWHTGQQQQQQVLEQPVSSRQPASRSAQVLPVVQLLSGCAVDPLAGISAAMRLLSGGQQQHCRQQQWPRLI